MGASEIIKKKILVVDDEGDLLELIGKRLESNGYTVLTLNSGEHVIEFARREKPDIILLDMIMPGRNGREVCKELKAGSETKQIPVIIFTAQYPEEEYVKVNSEEIGADDYVLKPFEAAELLAKIKYLIG